MSQAYTNMAPPLPVEVCRDLLLNEVMVHGIPVVWSGKIPALFTLVGGCQVWLPLYLADLKWTKYTKYITVPGRGWLEVDFERTHRERPEGWQGPELLEYHEVSLRGRCMDFKSRM